MKKTTKKRIKKIKEKKENVYSNIYILENVPAFQPII